MLNSTTLASQITARGITPQRAAAMAASIMPALAAGKPELAWSRLAREWLTPADPFELHRWLFEQCYGQDALTGDAGPAWEPTPESIARSNIADTLRELQLPDYPAMHQWSVQDRGAYWATVVRRLDIRLAAPWQRILDDSDPIHPRWLVGAQLNIVESCFGADDNAVAIVQSDGRSTLRYVSYGELRELTSRVAHGLLARGIVAGDAVAIVAPMTTETVAAYLAVVAVGAAVVSVADSFAAQEIATRLGIAHTKLVITQEAIAWGDKRLPLYEKVGQAAGGIPVVVLPVDATTPPRLRPGDVAWPAFLSSNTTLLCHPRQPSDTINILFSSGTTGQPKAIPWDQTTPIKCAADAHFHHDIHPGDVLCWPSNLGWMMGPWLIFAALINRASLALYAQTPQDRRFGQFVAAAGVTMLGGVPSLFRAWRQSQCMAGLDWSCLRAFSSSGECSNTADMLYLMHLAGYRPIIEYCGGTEIGGAYITATVVQPNAPGMFTTPALGIDLTILDERGNPASSGEAFLIGPSIGLSTRLLNRNHDEIYFAETPPATDGRPLRRHGDELQRDAHGHYRVIGRCDDTMNLGGIKVGCAEIERVLNGVHGVLETAAIALAPAGGGPSRLVVFTVLREANADVDQLTSAMRQAIRQKLNPLFHLDQVRIVAALPRTASNKVMRRELRAIASGPAWLTTTQR